MTGIHRNLPAASDHGASHRRRSWRYPGGPLTLREAWRVESAAGSGRGTWTRPEDWWVPEADAVAETLCARPARGTGPPSTRTPCGVVPACALLGEARAEAGVGLGEALDDLCAVFRLVPAGSPPLPAVRAFVEAWADVWLRGVAGAGCVDPLTQLATPAYLRTRLGECYRSGEAGRHALLAVALDTGTDGWRLVTRRLAVAATLRATWPGGETIAALSPVRCAALVARDTAGPAVLDRLRATLAERTGADLATWLVQLPADESAVGGLLTELGT